MENVIERRSMFVKKKKKKKTASSVVDSSIFISIGLFSFHCCLVSLVSILSRIERPAATRPALPPCFCIYPTTVYRGVTFETTRRESERGKRTMQVCYLPLSVRSSWNGHRCSPSQLELILNSFGRRVPDGRFDGSANLTQTADNRPSSYSLLVVLIDSSTPRRYWFECWWKDRTREENQRLKGRWERKESITLLSLRRFCDDFPERANTYAPRSTRMVKLLIFSVRCVDKY